MILVTNPAKPLELTAKGSVRRSVCLAKYDEEIEEIEEAPSDGDEYEDEDMEPAAPPLAPMPQGQAAPPVVGAHADVDMIGVEDAAAPGEHEGSEDDDDG